MNEKSDRNKACYFTPTNSHFTPILQSNCEKTKNDYTSQETELIIISNVSVAIQLPSSVNMSRKLRETTGYKQGMQVEECDTKGDNNRCYEMLERCIRLSYSGGRVPGSLFRTLVEVLIKIASFTNL